MKKIFIISSVLLLIILIFLVIYNFVFSDKSDDYFKTDNSSSIQDESITAEKEKELKVSENKQESEKNEQKEKIKPLTEEAVISPIISLDKKHIQYYSKENGNVWKINFDGSEKTNISQDVLTNLTRVMWSPKENKVISRFTQNRFYLYDHDISKGVSLKEGISDIAWTNMGDKIIYNYYDSKTNSYSLNLANPDGSQWKKMADLPSGRISIAPVPQSSLISYWSYPDAHQQNSLKTISLVGGEPKEIFSGKYGADYLWSPDSKKILISSSSEKENSKIVLGVTDSKGENYHSLNAPTLVSKCVWADGNKVYCAIPTSIPEGATMPNDYQAGKIKTKDTFLKIDVVSGKSERVVELDEITGHYDAENLMLSLYDGYLFFVNRIDGKIYRIDL